MINQDVINRRSQLNELSGVKKLSPTDFSSVQNFYDSGHTLRDCQEKFGYSRPTLIKYLKTRSRTKLHDEQKRKKNVEGVVSWRQRTKKKLVEYKGGKCFLCGYNRCVGSMHFHHKDPSQKEFNITALTISFEKLKSEVDKCVLVCSNCHGEIHAGLVSIDG